MNILDSLYFDFYTVKFYRGIVAKIGYFKDVTTSNGVITNREFWRVMKPMLTNKGIYDSGTIILEENAKNRANSTKLGIFLTESAKINSAKY